MPITGKSLSAALGTTTAFFQGFAHGLTILIANALVIFPLLLATSYFNFPAPPTREKQ